MGLRRSIDNKRSLVSEAAVFFGALGLALDVTGRYSASDSRSLKFGSSIGFEVIFLMELFLV